MPVKKTILYFFILLFLVSCQSKNKTNKELIIFHAGSLSVPFKEIVSQYNKENPDVNILMESAGSRQCARKITDLNRDCDIMASADYKVIDNLLIPDYADWNIKFAGNEMAIVYHEKSRHSDEINEDNWYNILLKEDVIFGRSNPDFDPCGYRTVLLTGLAENYYDYPGLANKLIEKNINYIRPKEVDLIGLLESDVIDYMFMYRSVAEQHELKYLVLPDSINLKNPNLDNLYATSTVKISGKKPGTYITKKGESMVYGLTILKNAPNNEEAIDFIQYLLSPEKGMAIMKKNGQSSLVPSQSSTYNKIPQELTKFAEKQ